MEMECSMNLNGDLDYHLIANSHCMQVDKTTLYDLGIFHTEEEQSVFHYLNFTSTNAGRDYLRYLLAHPLGSLKEISETQQTIQHLQNIAPTWPTTLTNGTIMVLQKFYESPIDAYPTIQGNFPALMYKLLKNEDYALSEFSVKHCIDFFKALSIIQALIENSNSALLLRIATRMQMLLKKGLVPSIIIQEKEKLTPSLVLEYAQYLRKGYKTFADELIDMYSELDAYMSLAIAGNKYNFTFPNFIESSNPYFSAKNLFHFQIQIPTPYSIQLAPGANFLFLTGANMAGKSTFIKACGLAVYLAHIGMAVPAEAMQLSYFDGILSNIQVTDNISKGESFFFNEVQRIKNTVERISDKKKWLILIDELFKGTNQQDAVKCSTIVIEGLRKMNNGLFILSTHLYEIATSLQHHPNISFRYFETAVENDQLVFSYHLKEGVSNDRLGYLILKQQGVVDILERL